MLAPQRSVRGYGGFVNVGFPLSRWFNADPRGHNAGWQLLFQAGLDAANAHDFRLLHDGAVPPVLKEHSWERLLCTTSSTNIVLSPMRSRCIRSYAQRATAGADAGTYIGAATGALAGERMWKDRREEFGPIFTF